MGVFVKLLSLGCSILASLKEAGYELASKYPPAEPGVYLNANYSIIGGSHGHKETGKKSGKKGCEEGRCL
jgi:hypothetical protein